MRSRALALPLAVVAALGLSALPATGVAKKGSTTTVKLNELSFSPRAKTISKNTTVVFKWAGGTYHDVVGKKGPVKFRSKLQNKGTYKKKFTRKGTYTIVCTVHQGMELKLKVK